ncbi:MAG: peptidoglycan-associated lipoprotein Pal [Candidatus Binatia bacterium]
MAVVLAMAALLAVGCSSKKKKDSGALGAEAGGTGYGEESLGAPRDAGSLALAQQGKLGEGEGAEGPLRDIHFDYDSFELDDTARQTLQSNADWLKDNPESRVEIEGHCDDRGTVEYNLALGAKRAAAAKDYLVAMGVGRERMTTISYGEELPLCHEETESCWSRNRRAHFVPAAN